MSKLWGGLLHLHVHDNRGEDDGHLVPGEGEIDLRALSSSLREAGYGGRIGGGS